MCLAVVQLPGKRMTHAQIRNAFARNSDGAGLAYPNNGKVVIIKPIFEIGDFIRVYDGIVDRLANVPMLVHFRMTTAGRNDKLNTHPHRINSRLAMIHNGILIGFGGAIKSDTVEFVENILKELPDGFHLNPGICALIKHAIGDYNKFCFLDGDGNYTIINEEAGYWSDGIWFSNNSADMPAPKGWADDADDMIEVDGVIRQIDYYTIEIDGVTYTCSTVDEVTKFCQLYTELKPKAAKRREKDAPLLTAYNWRRHVVFRTCDADFIEWLL